MLDKVALLVIGNGRLDYLHDTVDSALAWCPQFDHYLMVDDSGDGTVRRELDRYYPDFTIHHNPENRGMAHAVQQGFYMVLDTDADYVLWLEEDMRIMAELPLLYSRRILATNPHVAQMLYQRQCLTPQEHEAGSVVGAMAGTDHGWWTEHRHIFSLNPCLIPRRTLERGWPQGNEREMTDLLIKDGWTFGVWNKGPLVEHVGVVRGKQWQL